MEGASHIAEEDGFLVIDLRGCDSNELCEVYLAFGLLCARERVHGALLRIDDDDPEVHYTLRDVLTTVARVVKIPLHFRLALVPTGLAAARVCRVIQDLLGGQGCHARVFHREDRARQWIVHGHGPTGRRTVDGRAQRPGRHPFNPRPARQRP